MYVNELLSSTFLYLYVQCAAMHAQHTIFNTLLPLPDPDDDDVSNIIANSK